MAQNGAKRVSWPIVAIGLQEIRRTGQHQAWLKDLSPFGSKGRRTRLVEATSKLVGSGFCCLSGGVLKEVENRPADAGFFKAQSGRGVGAWQFTRPKETGVPNGFVLVGGSSFYRRHVGGRPAHGAHAYGGGLAGAIVEGAGSKRHALVGRAR